MCKANQLSVRCYTGELRTLNLRQKTKKDLSKVTVLQLKKAAMKEFPRLSGQSVGDVKLIYEAMPLDKDSAPLSEYGVKPESVVQMVRKVNGG